MMDDKEWDVEVEVSGTFRVEVYAEDEDDAREQAEDQVRDMDVREAMSLDITVNDPQEKPPLMARVKKAEE